MENGKNFPPDTIPRIEEEKRETGPPPEAPVPVPLTEAQRRFAAQYHALIYGFLLEKKLEIREYYDIAAIGYLHAVQRYFTEKSLHRYRSVSYTHLDVYKRQVLNSYVPSVSLISYVCIAS